MWRAARAIRRSETGPCAATSDEVGETPAVGGPLFSTKRERESPSSRPTREHDRSIWPAPARASSVIAPPAENAHATLKSQGPGPSIARGHEDHNFRGTQCRDRAVCVPDRLLARHGGAYIPSATGQGRRGTGRKCPLHPWNGGPANVPNSSAALAQERGITGAGYGAEASGKVALRARAQLESSVPVPSSDARCTPWRGARTFRIHVARDEARQRVAVRAGRRRAIAPPHAP